MACMIITITKTARLVYNGYIHTKDVIKIPGINLYEYQVAAMVNAERGKAGLRALVWDDKLSDIARLKSDDMRTQNYCGHESPVYGSPFDMLQNFRVDYRRAGENVAMGYRTPGEVMAGWMDSPGHRHNIMGSDYERIGVGVVMNPYGSIYWTQLFVSV